MLKKLLSLISIVGLILGFAPFAFAGGTDVQFNADTSVILTGPAITLIFASGSKMVSYAVSTTTLTISLDAGSTVTVKSNNLYTLNNSLSLGTNCNGTTNSFVTFTGSNPATVTVTPTTNVACQASNGGGSVSLPVPTVIFSATPSTITPGQASTLSWSTTNASAITISPNIGSVGSNGSLIVVPASTTIYTMTVSSSGGTATATTTVTVGSTQPTPPPVPTPTPTPTPTTIPPPIVFTPINLVNGTLVKNAGNPTVYMVVNAVLRPFNSAAIFRARGLKFTNVQNISADQFASAIVGRPVGYPDGTVIRGSGGTLYIVSADTKVGIPSMAVLRKLKLSLRKVVKVSDADLANYDDGGVAN